MNAVSGRRAIALALAVAGVVSATLGMARVWRFLSSPEQPSFIRLWPLPALYLIEVVVLAVIVLAAIVWQHRYAFVAAWAALGAISTMTLLGAMTIGLSIGLSLFFLIPASLVGEERQFRRVSRNLTAFVSGALLQSMVMLGVIQYVLRRGASG